MLKSNGSDNEEKREINQMICKKVRGGDILFEDGKL